MRIGKYNFPNGYGASVIGHGYGSERGLLEIAVLNSDGSIAYDTPITNDVIGWLSDSEAKEVLDRIAALPPR